ncbi:MAG: biotin/lipoyl-binding protein [Oscillospiraceae bacterium]|jgi:biotin carboxyl carrier protein|nr:biotin/lipoyl-binding protein [Oscillospiraceae bacterium]
MKRYNITVNGSVYDVMVEEADAAETAAVPSAKPAVAFVSAGKQGDIKIEAPMPGTIVDVKLSAGTQVQKGATVAVLEAMKMENDIVTAQSGTIVSINVKKGDSVNTGTIIATMTAV